MKTEVIKLAPNLECDECCEYELLQLVDWGWVIVDERDSQFDPALLLEIEFTWECRGCGKKKHKTAPLGRLG